ncbi:hypothetical protein [Alteromonas gilva]|uniref:Uncharacterized protein n=1 Tax=Alteromonas gilva TaxID=2987522 RepID=A0ABT5L6F1_9ALTE|nr:hypothetical protein [Alteromonas gilva]MDC8831951.1 hypothetical protein [Alteromonas gilva]
MSKRRGGILLILTLIVGVGLFLAINKSNPPPEKKPLAFVHDYLEGQLAHAGQVTFLQIYARQDGAMVGQVALKSEEGWQALLNSGLMALQEFDYNQLTLCFGYNFEPAATPLQSVDSYQTLTGVKGIEFEYNGRFINYCGLIAIATNRTPWLILEDFATQMGVDMETLNSAQLTMQTYENEQFYVDLTNQNVSALYRGNTLIPLSDVTQENVTAMSERLAGWLVNNTNKITGQTQYKYWPSLNASSTSNNMIRQFMASYALQVWANRQQDEALLGLAQQNLRYNLDTFYQSEDDIGYIEYSGKRKLGAAALAALAIHTSPDSADFERYYDGLAKAITEQWQADGMFRTFIRQERNDQHNFYPGEALYYWAHVIEQQGPSSPLLDEFMASARTYMAWHRNAKNPAFIPWHTQAYFKVWQITQDPFLADAIKEMNDWLVIVMQGYEEHLGYEYPDFQGRFYFPDGGLGPPHASATGVYLEGLIDAWLLAKQTGDETRQELYRLVIVKGIRHAMQLEFVDDAEMYYVKDKQAVRGGLRSRVYDNEIRVDNVQHNLLALLKILDRFTAEDFKP